MELYSYKMTDDYGFAPNPFGNYCTLTTCKPRIRKYAKVGDWVVGWGSRTLHHKLNSFLKRHNILRALKSPINNALICAMRIQEILTFDKYWHDSRFASKKVSLQSPETRRGDNIYSFETGKWDYHGRVFHRTQSEQDHDCSTTDHVLISETFYYFGQEYVQIPQHFEYLIPISRGHTIFPRKGTRTIKGIPKIRDYHCETRLVSEFLDWLSNNYSSGKIGEPLMFPQI